MTSIFANAAIGQIMDIVGILARFPKFGILDKNKEAKKAEAKNAWNASCFICLLNLCKILHQTMLERLKCTYMYRWRNDKYTQKVICIRKLSLRFGITYFTFLHLFICVDFNLSNIVWCKILHKSRRLMECDAFHASFATKAALMQDESSFISRGPGLYCTRNDCFHTWKNK